MAEQPKKPQRKRRSKKLNINKRQSWQDIVNAVDKKQVPIHIIESILVSLIDGTQVTINVKQLIENGEQPDDIEMMLDEKFIELDDYIKNVDFYVDVDSVEGTVQPETDKALKGL